MKNSQAADFAAITLKSVAVMVVAGALSACSAINGRWSQFNYGYNDVRIGNKPSAQHSAQPTAAQRIVPGVARVGAMTPVTADRSYGWSLVAPRSTAPANGPQLINRPITSNFRTNIQSAAPLVSTSRVVPNAVSEHAVCHSVSNANADPIGLPLSSIGYTTKNFLTLPTATQYVEYLYTQREVGEADRAFAAFAQRFDPRSVSVTYARTVLPQQVYGGHANRAVRLGNAQFLVDLTAVPGMSGGLHLCNLNGVLDIDRVDQNCCGTPLLIGRGSTATTPAAVATTLRVAQPISLKSASDHLVNVVITPTPRTTTVSPAILSPRLGATSVSGLGNTSYPFSPFGD